MQRHLFLVGYDIVCNRRRARVLRQVKGHAVGGQKSLYECWYTSAEFQKAMHAVRTMINTEEDRVVYVRLDPRASIHTIGVAVAPHDADFFYIA